MARKLRIAASVFFAAVAVALWVLLVRSYTESGQSPFDASSRDEFTKSSSPVHLPATKQNPALNSIMGRPAQRTVSMSYWAMIAGIAALVASRLVPWSFHFSLRTLLIATTLVAVVLGLGVWAAS